jgi:hypothetical protein
MFVTSGWAEESDSSAEQDKKAPAASLEKSVPAWDPYSSEDAEPIVMEPGKARQRGPRFTQEYIEKVNLKAEGIGFGFVTGFWEPSIVVGLKTVIPVNKKKNFNLKFRVFMPLGPFSTHASYRGHFDPYIGTEFGILIRTPVFFGLIRLFVGGGLYVGVRLNTFENDDKSQCWQEKSCRVGVTGGGGAGIEVFAGEKGTRAFFIEVGGQGPTHPLNYDMGAHVIAGSTWYFGK